MNVKQANRGVTNLGEAKSVSPEYVSFLHRCINNSGISSRFIVWNEEERPHVPQLDPGARNKKWAEWAPILSTQAAEKAIKQWGGDRQHITHIIFHSCTGFKAPGVELDLVDRLKLKNVERRLGINFMGCFGGFTGLNVAKTYVQTNPSAVVLLVCCELCSCHFSVSENRSKMIGNSVFSDGCAAAIIGLGKQGDWAIGDQASHTLGLETRHQMLWEPTSTNYCMYLDRDIANSLGKHLLFTLKQKMQKVCHVENVQEVEWCVHPGGRGILDALCAPKYRLNLTKEMLRHSYQTLDQFGNMSSGTILFVIKSMIDEQRKNSLNVDAPALKDSAFCLGFGPGLTVETAALHKIQ